MLKKKIISCLFPLDVLFLNVLEERAPPQTSLGGHPACRNLSKHSAVQALLKKGKPFTLPAPTRWKPHVLAAQRRQMKL